MSSELKKITPHTKRRRTWEKKKSVYLYDSSLTVNIQEYENKTVKFYEPYFSYMYNRSMLLTQFFFFFFFFGFPAIYEE